MALNISQEDFNVVRQPFINKYLKLNILNFNLSVVNEISGNLISCDVSVNADSDLRRSCTINLVVTDSSFEPKSGSQIWLDKFVQPYVGYENIYTGEIQWYNQGIYLINTPTYFYDATNNTLSFQGLDLMSKLTGVRNGALEGVPTVIPQGSNVREAMIASIKLAGFTKYVIDECTNVDGSIQAVPYDIQVNQGGYIFDIIKQLRDILPNYQVYFDVNGVFHYDQIPSGDNDPVLIDDVLWNDVNTSDNITTDFESVKNYIEVYGKTHSPDMFPTSTTTYINNLSLFFATNPTTDTIIGFVPSINMAGNIYIRHGTNVTQHKLLDSSGNYIKHLDKDVYYVAKYKQDGNYLFMGRLQAQAIAKDDNPESPFYVDGSVGVIREVLSGGDYDNIMTDELALQRAKLEIYWKCRLNDSITLTCVPIPWVDVNILISHAPKNTTKQKKYMIKSFSASYGSVASMTINAISYYAYYNPTPQPTPILPEGYTQLNYIQSSGTQFIGTGVIPDIDTKIIINFTPLAIGSDDVMCGVIKPNIAIGYKTGFITGGFKNDTGYSVDVPESVVNTTYDAEIFNGHFVLNGEDHVFDAVTSYSTTRSIYLFAGSYATVSDGAYGKVTAKLSMCKIYTGNTLLRNFIPCMNPSGEIGLYDLVSKEFFGNIGTGTFIAGEEVTN